MGEIVCLRRGLAATASLSVIAGLLAACSPGPVAPAPVYLRGVAQAPAKVTAPWHDNTIFTVRRGDTVIDIAHDYHVPLGALIAANQLRTPYLIHPGDRLLIPDGGVPPGDVPATRMATTAPTATPATTPSQVAVIPPSPAPSAPPQTVTALPPAAPAQVAAAAVPPAPTSPAIAPPPTAPAQVAAATPPPPAPTSPTPTSPTTPLPRPTPPAPVVTAQPLSPPPAQVVAVTTPAQPQWPPPAQVAAVTTPAPPPSTRPQTAAAQITPASPQSPAPTPAKTAAPVVPLDQPAKPLAAIEPPPPAVAPATATTNAGPPSVLAARNPAAALPLPGEAVPTMTVGTQNGRFLWPVHGRILANYGLSNGETHNQGIDIAAPLGTLVRAADAGTVAYAGSEVKGYGNLVLIKHANGWISAYAHLDDIVVQKGDTVSAGEVIAKVGDTGGVGEPQLHFELRRGKKPVDPKEFLDSAGSATAKPAQQAG